MAVFMKKTLGILVLVLIFINMGVAETNATTDKYGDISFYDGVGKVGSDGKILTKYDVAVSYVDRHVPKGSTILTLNRETGIKKTLYKWDYGSFGGTVILDVQRQMFTEMGGVISKGYFKGRIMF